MVSIHSQWHQAHLLDLEGAPNTVGRPLGSCWNDVGELLSNETHGDAAGKLTCCLARHRAKPPAAGRVLVKLSAGSCLGVWCTQFKEVVGKVQEVLTSPTETINLARSNLLLILEVG